MAHLQSQATPKCFNCGQEDGNFCPCHYAGIAVLICTPCLRAIAPAMVWNRIECLPVPTIRPTPKA
jgi:hypothetical protein